MQREFPQIFLAIIRTSGLLICLTLLPLLLLAFWLVRVHFTKVYESKLVPGGTALG